MYKVTGKITSIDEVKTLDNGAKVVNYIVDQTSENGYVTVSYTHLTLPTKRIV